MHQSPQADPRKWQRLDGVDILRGLAIFFVLMNHVHIRLLLNKVAYSTAIPPQLLSSLVWNGQYGVQIFFAVSGFLITAMTLRRWGSLSQVRIGDFYLLRFARIAPLLLALLGILSLLHLARFKPFVVSAARGGLGQALFAALTFHVNWLEATRGYLPPSWDVLWSLSVEEVFYLFFPVVCVWLGRGKMLLWLLAALVIAGPFGRTLLAHNEVWKEYSYLGSMDAIAMGCLTALALNQIRPARRTVPWLRVTGVALLILLLGFSVTFRRLAIAQAGLDMSLVALGTCLVIAAVAQSGGSGPAAVRPLVWLGQRSYEVYLTHMFVVLGLLNIFVAAGKPPGGVPLFFVGTVIVSGILGALVARFYSEPMNRLLRKRWGRNTAVQTPF
jgi:peptidoglycan/LPS O-acetylase OafA/YrhL